MSSTYRITHGQLPESHRAYAEKAAELEEFLKHSNDPAAHERLAMLKAILEEIIEQAGESAP